MNFYTHSILNLFKKMADYTIPLGSKVWFIGNISTILSVAFLLWIPKYFNQKQKDNFRVFLGFFFISVFLAYQIYTYSLGRYSLEKGLPFHLCGLSMIFGFISLLNKNQQLFEWSAFFGIAGGYQSLLTPELTNGYSFYYLIQYYLDHGGVIMMPLFMGIYFEKKTRPFSWLKALVFLNVLAFFMYFLNIYLNSNYMFVNKKPDVDNAFLIGDWPWYLVVLEIICLLHFYIIHVAFNSGKKWI